MTTREQTLAADATGNIIQDNPLMDSQATDAMNDEDAQQ